MAKYIYSVETIKYGTPTGTNTMPGTLTALPDTVKGSITVDETEGASQEFYVDQKRNPIMTTKTEEGKMTLTAQFYDMDYDMLAALKGGNRVTGASLDSFVPSTGYTNVLKALQITLDSGHVLEMFNANIFTRITGGGGRDKMFAVEMKATPLMTTDLAGSWRMKDE